MTPTSINPSWACATTAVADRCREGGRTINPSYGKECSRFLLVDWPTIPPSSRQKVQCIVWIRFNLLCPAAEVKWNRIKRWGGQFSGTYIFDVCVFIQSKVKIKCGVSTCMHRLLETVAVMPGELRSTYHTVHHHIRENIYKTRSHSRSSSLTVADVMERMLSSAWHELRKMIESYRFHLYLNCLRYYLT